MAIPLCSLLLAGADFLFCPFFTSVLHLAFVIPNLDYHPRPTSTIVCQQRPYHLPNIDLHMGRVAQGGVAAVAAPVMGPVSDMVVSTFGDTILVEMGMHVGFDLTAKAANDLVFDGAIKTFVPIHSSRLETTGVKTMTITLKYKHVPEDASVGFYRSGIHR